MKSRPVLIVFSILAGLDIVATSAGLSDIIGLKQALVFILATKAVQVGMTFYVQNLTVPVQDVAAFVSPQLQIVAGPAAQQANGAPVEVIPADAA
jgi:hypothetical protein